MKLCRPIWRWIRHVAAYRRWHWWQGRPASALPSPDDLALDARRRRHVNRVQDETLARVTFGLG